MMTMTLPNNAIALEQEEMMYLDAGWSWDIAYYNVTKLQWGVYAWATRAIANYIKANPGAGMRQTVSAIGGEAAKFLWLLPTWAKVLGLAAGAMFIYAIGTWYIF